MKSNNDQQNERYDELEKLLHLKRYEHPPEGFYERFLDDLHDRQRLEIMQRSSWSLFWDRVETWFWGVGSRKRVYLAGMAYATVMIGLYFRAGDGDYQANVADEFGNSTTVIYDMDKQGDLSEQGNRGGRVPRLDNDKPSNESIVPAGIQSFLREF
ncbi:MAG: hypothetical protein L3J39_18345 [Verrucomicrobiales bacterium]|nr:hypothetical protein [Verrucomicrobiales bacterium]